MDALKQRIEADQLTRYKILLYMLTESKGDQRYGMLPEITFDALSIDASDGGRALQYLTGEGLIKLSGGRHFITHAGVVEMEESISNPHNRTVHFPAPVIQYVVTNNFNGSVTAVQSGDGNVVVEK